MTGRSVGDGIGRGAGPGGLPGGDPAPGPARGRAPALVRRVAWFHCFAGIAGDMALGSLLDAGADLPEVERMLARLPFEGWRLDCERVLRAGIACTRVVVSADDDTDGRGRSYADVVGLVRAAALPERVTTRALAAFEALATAEGRLHGRTAREAHLHEVGAHDAVVDVVGTAAALEVLGIDEVTCSPVAVGTGVIGASHGTLPNPPPAVLRLLEDIPVYGRPLDVELTTPTGAALLRSLAARAGPLPAMTVTSSGYGAGEADIDGLPNCTQVVVGDAVAPEAAPGPGQRVVLLEANLDDATGEQLGLAVAALLDAGAFDAWVTPAVMKKGRPGHVVHALCDRPRAEALGAVVRETTGSFGVRAMDAERWADARRIDEVAVTGETVRMKVSRRRAKAEPDDVARAAARTGLSVREVASRAEEAWRRRSGVTPAHTPDQPRGGAQA